MEGVIFVADVKIVGREEMCKWKNFVERMKLILGYRKEQLLLAQEELRKAIIASKSKAAAKAIISRNTPTTV